MDECTCDLILTVEEPDEIELSFVEAKIKPEQTKNVVPDKTEQAVYPDPGFTLGAVNVAAIPPEYIIPSGTENITENGDHDVTAVETAHVAIPDPVLQQKTVTPTEQQQTVEADSGYDALSRVTVERIPSEYIVPADKITLTENATDVDISQYATADIAVPVPVMPDEYCVGGSLIAKTLTEYHCEGTGTEIRARMFDGCSSLRSVNLPNSILTIKGYAFSGCSALELSQLPTSLSSIETYAFSNCEKVSFIDIPSAVTITTIACFSGCIGLTEINFLGNITTVANATFSGCSNVLVYKFLHNTAVPPMNNTNAFNAINPNAKIVVPDSLVTAWKTATNWVTYADKIIGESEYNG